MTKFRALIAIALVLIFVAVGWKVVYSPEAAETAAPEQPAVIRVGYFPNITHSQALIGLRNGDFQKALGPRVKIEAKVFNAGPSVIEALFAGELDLSYIGPNPTINGYIKSGGEALRVVAGSTSGGAVLVVQPDFKFTGPKDMEGKTFASPQFGNTQDVALRYYIVNGGLELAEKGGSVKVVPMANPDILTLFLKREIEGAWVPEPWGARLTLEGNGKLAVDERDLWPGGQFVTANIIVSTKFLKEHPDLVKKWLSAHVDVTRWIQGNPVDAQKQMNEEIKRITGKALGEKVLEQAMGRLEATWDPIAPSLRTSAEQAYRLGFLGKSQPDLSKIYDLRLLNEVLEEKGLPPVRD